MSVRQQEQRLLPSKYILEDVCWAIDKTVLALSRKEAKVENLQGLLKEEEEFYASIRPIDVTAVQHEVNVPSSWRKELCNWAYGVVDHFGLDREVVSNAMNFLDLVATSPTASSISKKDYVLLAVASLYLAAKECASRKPGSFSLGKDRLAFLCQGAKFQVEDIEKAEACILSNLNGASSPPSSLVFVGTLLHLCPGWKRDRSQGLFKQDTMVLRTVGDVARHLVEVGVFEANWSLVYTPSLVAYAACLCAMEALQGYLPLPYYARVRYLNNVAEASGLLPSNTRVLQAVQILKDACPKMFQGDELITQFIENSTSQDISSAGLASGRSSPVAVLDH